MAAESLTSAKSSLSSARRGFISNALGDSIFYWITLLFAASVLIVALLIGGMLMHDALPSMRIFGTKFLHTSHWDPVQEKYGALPFIFGTLVTSFFALLIAVPVGVGTAVFLSDLAPQWVRTPLSFVVELLAAVPSVVYGLWGFLVLVPKLRDVQSYLSEHTFPVLQGWETSLGKIAGLGWVPRFGLSHLIDGPPYGIGIMAASLVLSIMVLPFITAVSRDVLRAVPSTQREAAFGLGATHWEALHGPVLRYARGGIMGAIILGLARALGETMAVTMVIGNSPTISSSLFSQGYTLASVLANEFAEATTETYISVLVQIAFVLFCTTIVTNAVARLLIWSMTRNSQDRMRE